MNQKKHPKSTAALYGLKDSMVKTTDNASDNEI